MRLKSVVIRGYKSIKDTVHLLIDDRVTVLIGANDHGKSNLLQAISKLNGKEQIQQEEKNWDFPKNDPPTIEWHFKIEDGELDHFKRDVAKNESRVDSSDSTSETPDEEEYFDINANQEIVYLKEDINADLSVTSVPFKMSVEDEPELLKIYPKVELFTSPVATNLKDDVTLAELTTPEFEFMQGIFHLSGLWEHKDTIFAQNSRTSKLLDEASERLTAILNDKWNQGRDLVWKLTHSGTSGDHITIQIKDPSIDSQFSRPSSRSSGFQTFFILSMITNARKYNNPNNKFIFLFDEPGSYLHPYAQLDLQRSFESVSDKAQIIYTTHSLFLINKNHPQRNRVVSKTKEGTKIDQKPFQKNWKAVRESLGILLSNNFLIAEKTLLVEGPSDIIYLHDVINRLKKEGRVDIDLNDFSVVDAGSSENYVAMAKLMLSEGRGVMALVDGDMSGKRIKTKLEKMCQTEIQDKKLNVLVLDDNKSIEDIFCDINILKKSIESLSAQLSATDDKAFNDDFDLAVQLDKIKRSESKSLGLTILETTKTWLRSGEALSKLSIALIYEDVVQKEDFVVNEDAFEVVKKLKENMQLKGEKSADKGVFEEI